MHVARIRLPRPIVCALPKWRLQRVQEYIDAHLDSALSLSDLASVVGLSRMHFAAQFRGATGYRPHEFFLSRRIEKAKAILSDTSAPIAEVALSVGFQAQSHFSTVFKRLTGDASARWRRMIASERERP
jgi:AraC family transcriptional regulator